MKQLIKVKNSDLSLRLNLNYNNVYARLKMLLGSKASLFADLSAKSTWTWFSDDDAEYTSLADAPKAETNAISIALTDAVSNVRKEIESDDELSKYVEDILEIPDNGFVFYRKNDNSYKFILAGWGCRYAHQSTTEANSFIKHISRELPEEPIVEEPKKPSMTEILGGLETGMKTSKPSGDTIDGQATTGSVTTKIPTGPSTPTEPQKKTIQGKPKDEVKKQIASVKVLDQNNSAVKGEKVIVRSSIGEETRTTSDDGKVEVGELPYGETFSVAFPNLQGNVERSFEVIPGTDTYDAYIKKLVKYSPVLFIEDQNGNSVQDYNVKVIISGQDSVYNSGLDGVVQLPTMQEGQKFIVIDTANYANTEEYNVTQAEAKTPYHFHIRRVEQTKVGITVLDKSGNPIPNVSVQLAIGDTPCQALTAENGRAEFPSNLFVTGDIPATLNIKGQGTIKSNLKYTPDISEYTIQLRNKKKGIGKFDWKWLLLIPLILIFGLGGNELYKHLIGNKTPTIEDMESGVGLILVKRYFYVDLKLEGIKIDGNPTIAYFNYDENEKEISNLTFDPQKATYQYGTGTGFLISEDGLIATNRHIANPITPDEVAVALKKHFQDQKDQYQDAANKLNDKLQILGGVGRLDSAYFNARAQLQYCLEQVRIFDKIVNTGQYKVEVKCYNSIAFTNTRIEDENDFISCSQPRAWGEPGGVTENDVAIIQIKKKQDVPKEAFIFTVPEKDLMDEKIPDDYEITVLGYNAGVSLQDMKLLEGIKPQAQHGKITRNHEKYRIQYDAPTLGGSSGSPVVNKQGQLVAINNSGVGGTQGFNCGVRTKYLKELLDNIQKKDKKTE